MTRYLNKYIGMVAVVLAMVGSFGLAPRQAAQAADSCQHEDHWHYHFPTAHSDFYDYLQHYTEPNGQHFHRYVNTTHGNFFWKQC